MGKRKRNRVFQMGNIPISTSRDSKSCASVHVIHYWLEIVCSVKASSSQGPIFGANHYSNSKTLVMQINISVG